jgi:hypothetical protein
LRLLLITEILEYEAKTSLPKHVSDFSESE